MPALRRLVRAGRPELCNRLMEVRPEYARNGPHTTGCRVPRTVRAPLPVIAWPLRRADGVWFSLVRSAQYGKLDDLPVKVADEPIRPEVLT